MKSAFLALTLLLLCGCASPTLEGRILKTGETFTGTSSTGMLGGSLEFQSDKGTRCEGRTISSATVGSTVAVITCDDGRAGSVVFLDGPSQSVGTGLLGNDEVTLTITK